MFYQQSISLVINHTLPKQSNTSEDTRFIMFKIFVAAVLNIRDDLRREICILKQNHDDKIMQVRNEIRLDIDKLQNRILSLKQKLLYLKKLNIISIILLILDIVIKILHIR